MSKEQTTKVSLAEFKKIYSRIFSYALKYKWTLFVSIFSLVILALTNTGFLALIKKITDEGFVEQASNSIFLSIALVITKISNIHKIKNRCLLYDGLQESLLGIMGFIF